jgi:hypothetical protein
VGIIFQFFLFFRYEHAPGSHFIHGIFAPIMVNIIVVNLQTNDITGKSTNIFSFLPLTFLSFKAPWRIKRGKTPFGPNAHIAGSTGKPFTIYKNSHKYCINLKGILVIFPLPF